MSQFCMYHSTSFILDELQQAVIDNKIAQSAGIADNVTSRQAVTYATPDLSRSVMKVKNVIDISIVYMILLFCWMFRVLRRKE